MPLFFLTRCFKQEVQQRIQQVIFKGRKSTKHQYSEVREHVSGWGHFDSKIKLHLFTNLTSWKALKSKHNWYPAVRRSGGLFPFKSRHKQIFLKKNNLCSIQTCIQISPPSINLTPCLSVLLPSVLKSLLSPPCVFVFPRLCLSLSSSF